ncbi:MULTISPECIES: response regulator [unclassified Rhizobium]|uniref:response regulator n=1 Tax=unclassified Rhizobium TaxID=2613769 RepID=UPI0007EB92B2|nr:MULTISPECIES: response regulator [unclassified Rhizobium]ANM13214.1 response regulator CheY-like domain-containing protein [Rhizobium sp. N324]ANM19612.1 response regulator CheY-like domain-containing protein [Rhizobium sp. N541]ANM25997.1 response regulator CheY-like domain-containing protein [Rhizobium sp. N941]OYD01007.1 response regulator CheY-like domain-containing protein [Rhizobium sp. N4311]
MEKNNLAKLFSGKRVLIVEDEYFLADETRRKLEDLGAVVIGPTSNVSRALDLINREHIDAAILDVYLGDELVFAVADELEARDINFVFATGYDPAHIPVKYKGFALCEKPAELEQIAVALFHPAGGSERLN